MSEERKKRARRKPASELTTKEVMRRMFPKEVREETTKEVKKADQKGSRPSDGPNSK